MTSFNFVFANTDFNGMLQISLTGYKLLPHIVSI